MFYPLFDWWRDSLLSSQVPGLQGSMANFLGGGLTGATTAVLMNPFNAIKYQMWGFDNLTMRGTAQKMYNQRGPLAFYRAVQVTVMRDGVFGWVYSGSRLSIAQFMETGAGPSLPANVMAASLAVAISSPFNYARNMQFGAAGKAPSMISALQRLHGEAITKRQLEGRRAELAYIIQRLALGWGTLRVGVGMAVGQKIYDHLMTCDIDIFS